MKFSIYNSDIPISQNFFLLYNAYMNMFVVVTKELHNALIQLSIENLQEKHASFFQQLIEAGCLVNDDVDEVTLLKQRINQVESQEESYTLIINPTISCNFKCWYCYEKHLSKSKMTSLVLENVKKHITNIMYNSKLLKTFNLSFFGGEPLLYYKDVVAPLIYHTKELSANTGINTSISFTSNGYLITDTIIAELKDHNVRSFQITLDGNKEFHNKVRYPYKNGDSYTKILSNVKKLLKAEIYVVLRINYTKENLFSTHFIVEDLKDTSPKEKNYLSIDFQRVWQDKDANNAIYDENLEKCVETFKTQDLKICSRIINQVWYPCYADLKNQALVNFNGDVYKCTARDFNVTNKLGILNDKGDIEWEQTKIDQRANLRLSQKICLNCRIAPLCGSTCTQRILDKGEGTECIRGLKDSGKDNIVLDRFCYSFIP